MHATELYAMLHACHARCITLLLEERSSAAPWMRANSCP